MLHHDQSFSLQNTKNHLLDSSISNFWGNCGFPSFLWPKILQPLSPASEIKIVKHHQPDYANHVNKDLRHVQQEKTFEWASVWHHLDDLYVAILFQKDFKFWTMKRHWKRTQSNKSAHFAPNTGVQQMTIITSPLSTSLLFLICSRKSFLGCTVVSAPNGPQSQVPPDHMGEAWAKGASGWVSNRHAAFNETVLKHTHWKKNTHLSRRQVIKNRTATGYHYWNPSKLEDVPSCITFSPAVSLHFEDGTCFSENFTSHPYC